MKSGILGAALATCFVASTGGAQTADTPTPTAATPSRAVIPALMLVEIEIATAIDSKSAKIGQMFPIRLAAPLTIDGKEVIPAGASGEGEVVHAARARAAGKAGELILAARYIEHSGIRLPLRSFKIGRAAGQSRADEALVAGAVVAPLTLLIAGGELAVTPGTRGIAKVAAATEFQFNK